MSDELSDEPIELSEKPISSSANEIHLYTTCVPAHPRVTLEAELCTKSVCR